MWVSLPCRVPYAVVLVDAADRFRIREEYTDLIVREEEMVSSLGDSRCQENTTRKTHLHVRFCFLGKSISESR